MANTFLLAQGKPVGKSLAEPDRVEDARRDHGRRGGEGHQGRPAGRRRGGQGGHPRLRVQDDPRREGPGSWHIVDVGKQSLELSRRPSADVQTVLWNGPLGVFEIPCFAHGTKAIARFLATAPSTAPQVVIGGGDSVAAITQQGLADKMTHISTGGGASPRVPRGPRAAGRHGPAGPADRRSSK